MRSNSKIRELYEAAVDQHNDTSLARDLGYFHSKNRFTLRQAEIITSYLPTAGHFLDIGTGPCLIPRVVKKLGYRVSTVDSPDASESTAIEIAKSLGIETFSAHVGRDPVPLPDASVDVVGAFDVIEHLPDSPRPFLNEIMRLLKPSGYLVLGTPNAVRLTTRIKVAMGYSNWPAVADYIDTERNWGHHHEYTLAELREILETCGYRVILEERIEARLGQTQLDSISEIRTQVRKHTRGKKSLMTLATSVLKIWTSLVPSLRSEIVLIATPN